MCWLLLRLYLVDKMAVSYSPPSFGPPCKEKAALLHNWQNSQLRVYGHTESQGSKEYDTMVDPVEWQIYQ